MADGQFPTLVSKDQDANAVANPIFTSISDGGASATLTGTSLDVNITGGSTGGQQYADDTAHASGDLGNGALVVRQDTPASLVTADGDYTHMSVDANGKLYCILTDTVTVAGTVAVSSVAGTVTVSATNLDIRDLAFATDKVDVSGSAVTAVVTATDLDIRDLAFATDKVDVSGSAITAVVSATDLDIRDLALATDAVRISGNSSANSLTNPIFVQVTNGNIAGEVNSYSTATIAAAATSNHDYTVVTGMKLKSVEFACSGSMKIEIQVGPVGSLVSKAVGFIPSQGGNNRIMFDPPIEIPTTSTGTVRVIRTNRNNQSADVYSTILGLDN